MNFVISLCRMESECRMLKSAMADLKKEIAKKSVTCTTSTSAEEEEEKEGTFEAIYVHSTETVIFNQYNPLCEDLVLCDHNFQKQEPTHQPKIIWNCHFHWYGR